MNRPWRSPLSRDRFVHLEVESAYTFLHGTFDENALVEKIKRLGQSAAALTDRWSIHGAVRFSESARRNGIQSVIGARLMLGDGSWITLLVKDRQGFRNLNRLITLGISRKGRHYISACELRMHATGLVCIAAGFQSRTRSLAWRGDANGARISLIPLMRIFGDDLHIAICSHVREDRKANRILSEIAAGFGVKTVASNLAAFLDEEDLSLHRVMIDIQKNHHHRDVHPFPNTSFRLFSGPELINRTGCPEAVDTAGTIAEKVANFAFPLGKLHPPLLETEGKPDTKLSRLALQALARKMAPVPPAYLIRLLRELEVVCRKGLSGFFLLVKRLHDFAEKMGIISSIRGSSAGSLIVHLLLNGPDPIRHDLLFERFINEGRGDMPDIDIDFDSERRDEVTEWLTTFLPGQTALVCTIHSFKVRSAVRLAARALGYPLEEISRFTECLPWSLRGIGLTEAMERLPELRDSPLRSEERLVRFAERLEGLPFQKSVHLGGVIVAPNDILCWSPVEHTSKGFMVSQLDKDDVDSLGLLKLDLLGLRMHTAIRKTKEALAEKKTIMDPGSIPLNDPETYRLIRSTDTLGVFQLESPGQRNLVGRLAPEKFEDIVAEISLFRPGPVKSDMVERYVKRRHGKEPVTFPHPSLEPVLRETYGIIVFQEQVLEVVHVFCGFSYAEADSFRRAMTRERSVLEMARLRNAFMEGAKGMGHSRKAAEKVFERVAAFAAYGFCKAHAAAFAEITLQSAYLKTHYPCEFYIGLLNAGHVGSYPPSVILNEAKRRGIPVYPPHVNHSGTGYVPEGSGIRLPLNIIHHIGPGTVRRIMTERHRNGYYGSAEEFRQRTSLRGRVFAALMVTGALPGRRMTA